MDAGPLTLRKLCWMLKAKERHDGRSLIEVICAIHNANPYRQGKALNPNTFFNDLFGKKRRKAKVNEPADLDGARAVFQQWLSKRG